MRYRYIAPSDNSSRSISARKTTYCKKRGVRYYWSEQVNYARALSR